MSWKLYKDLILETLKSKTVIGTDADGKVIDATASLNDGTVDHGSTSGKSDDDHAQYVLVDGTRPDEVAKRYSILQG